jgi:hypothetical protein
MTSTESIIILIIIMGIISGVLFYVGVRVGMIMGYGRNTSDCAESLRYILFGLSNESRDELVSLLERAKEDIQGEKKESKYWKVVRGVIYDKNL